MNWLFRTLTLGVAALVIANFDQAVAVEYPTRPIHWIVAFPAGGANDIVARIIGQFVSERLGQPVIIENKAGAGGNVGTQAALAASPDGYTLLFVAPHNAINATLYKKLPFDFLRGISPIAGIAQTPNIMEVIFRFRRRPLRNLSPTPKPIPARSIWRQPATERRSIFPVSCSWQ